MAEYRGLTIRIGADTSRFTAALKATQSAIASTQKNLRQLKQALTFDPGSKNASALYVGELQSQAVAASAKLQELRRHIKEVESAIPKSNTPDTFGQIAEKTDNAALAAQRAKAAYNDVTDALAQIYTNISAKSHDAFDFDDTEVKRLTQSLKDAGIASKEVKAVLGSSMESIRQELTSKGKASADQIEQIMKKVEAFKNQGVTINVTNSSMDTITSELQRLVEAGKISQDEMDETIVRVSRLKDNWTYASNAYDDAKIVDQLHNDSVEVARLEAQVKSLAEQMVDATRNAFADGLDDDIQKLRNLGTELDRAEGGFKRADEAFRLDPSNVDLSISRMQALDEATEAAKREAESLTDIIGQYEAAGIDQVAASTENLTQATADAKQNWVDATAEVIKQEQAIDEFMTKLRQDRVDGKPQSIIGTAKQYREMTDQLDQLKEKQAEAQESYQRLVNAGDYTEKVAELETVNNKITEFGNTARDNEAVINALAESMRNAFSNRLESLLEGDKSALEGLGDETRRVMDDLNRVERAMELNPSSIDRVAERSKALETAMAATSREMEQTQRILDGYSAAGIDKVAESSTNLTQDLKDAEAYAQAAAIALASYKTNVSDIDSGALEFFEDNLSNAVARVNELKSAMDFKDKKGQLADLQNEYAELGNKVDNTTAHLRALANAQVGRVGGGIESAIASLNSDLDALSDKTDAAVSHFEALDKAYQVKPTNLERAKDRLDALAEATTKAKEEAAELDSQIARLSGKGFDKVLASTKNIAKATDDAKKRWEDAEAAVKIWQERLSKAQAEVKRLESNSEGAGDELKEAQEQAAKIAENLDKASSAADRTRDRFTELSGAGELAELKTRRDAIAGVISDLEGETKSASEGISTSLFMALQEVGQEAKQALDSVVSATTSLDDALTEVKKTVDTTEEGYEGLKESAVKLSKVQPIDASTILQAEALGGQLGFMADEVERFAEVATGLDVATNMSWSDASTDMARFFNIMGLGHDEVENYGSAIVDLGNHYATTEQEISDMALRIAGAGASMNLGAADVLGLATALTSVGLTAEAGGSSISQIMVKIDKAVANGTQGIEDFAKQAGMSVNEFVSYLSSLDDDAFGEVAKSFGMTSKAFRSETLDSMEALQTWADTANMTADEFVDAWKNKPIEALTALFSGMDQAAEEGSNLNLLLDQLGITTIRQSDVARRVANSSGKLVEAVSDANSAYQENTALSTEVARRNESLSAQMDIMANSFDAVKAELGEGLLPIVKLSVSMFQDFSDSLDGVPTGLKTTAIAMIGLVSAIGTTYPVIHQIAGAFKTLAEKVTLAGGLGKVISGILTPSNLAIAALGAIGFAAYKYYRRMEEAKKRQADFNAALSDVGKTASSSASAMKVGTRAVSSFGSEAESKAMSMEELTEELKSFNDMVKNTLDPVDKGNQLLGEYQTVIDKFAGKGRATAEDMALLQWAVDGINEALGTNYSAQDILMDKYSDEEGEIDNLCAQIDKLIEKRQAQAKADAAQDLYTESLKEQMKIEKSLVDAQDEYSDAVEKRNKIIAEDRDGGNQFRTQKEIVENAERIMKSEYGIDMSELRTNLKATEDAYVEVGGAVEDYKNLMIEAAKETYDASEIMAQFTQGAFSDQEFGWGKALERNNINLEDFAKACEDAQISASDLQSIYDDKDVFFADMVDESAGSIDNLIDIINRYKSEHPSLDLDVDDATANAQQLEEQVRQSTGNMALDIKSFVTDEMPQLGQALRDSGTDDIAYWANKMADAGVTVDDLASIGEDGFARLAEGCNGNVDKMIDKIVEFNGKKLTDKSVMITAGGNVVDGSASLAVQRLVDFASRLYDKTVNYHVNVTTSGDLSTAGALAEKFRAAGGIRYHADGMILNHPTWIGHNDIAGEAGAEAIIPLTNRRYVQPFADTVADGMMSKLNELQAGGSTYNITVNAAGDTGDEIARAITRELRAYQLMTNGR